MATTQTLYTESDHILELSELTDSYTNEVLSEAVGTLYIYDEDGIEIGGPYSFIESSTLGTYYVIIPSTLETTDGQILQGKVIFTSDSKTNTWFVDILVEKRKLSFGSSISF